MASSRCGPPTLTDYTDRFRKALLEALAQSHPALQRGLVRCDSCGIEIIVDSATCLRDGWPVCCGETMRLVTKP